MITAPRYQARERWKEKSVREREREKETTFNAQTPQISSREREYERNFSFPDKGETRFPGSRDVR